MKYSSKAFLSIVSLLSVTRTSALEPSRTQFASHVIVNTPARSYTHGVGDPVGVLERRVLQRQTQPRGTRRPVSLQNHGYLRQKPAVPFSNEELTRDSSVATPPWRSTMFIEYSIPILPQSPYKVDSPDPESLWPTGLFLPPVQPPHFESGLRRLDNIKADSAAPDPYLLDSSDAVAAARENHRNGLLYFQDIPHIESLLANQELRVKNNLKPHRLGSIRQTWPFYRV